MQLSYFTYPLTKPLHCCSNTKRIKKNIFECPFIPNLGKNPKNNQRKTQKLTAQYAQCYVKQLQTLKNGMLMTFICYQLKGIAVRLLTIKQTGFSEPNLMHCDTCNTSIRRCLISWGVLVNFQFYFEEHPPPEHNKITIHLLILIVCKIRNHIFI